MLRTSICEPLYVREVLGGPRCRLLESLLMLNASVLTFLEIAQIIHQAPQQRVLGRLFAWKEPKYV